MTYNISHNRKSFAKNFSKKVSLVLIASIFVLLCIFESNINWHSLDGVIFYGQRIGQTLSQVLFNVKPLHIPDIVNIVKIRKEAHNFVKGVLRFDGKSVEMFLHGKQDFISQHILKDGMWEGHWINQLMLYLKTHPGMQLIDAGCNLGVYTLVAATLGHKVIAIDANKNNTDRLAQSVLVNNLTDRVTIVLNALSNERKTFSMFRVDYNIGGQMVMDNQKDPYQVWSIYMDDLLPLLDTKKDVMMKMDIETHEIRALKAASNLFNKTNIKLIQMEWVGLKNFPESYTLMGFLLGRNYTAHKDFYSKEELPRSNYQAWPFDVIWRRN